MDIFRDRLMVVSCLVRKSYRFWHCQICEHWLWLMFQDLSAAFGFGCTKLGTWNKSVQNKLRDRRWSLSRTTLGKVPCPTAQADFSPMALSRFEPGTSWFRIIHLTNWASSAPHQQKLPPSIQLFGGSIFLTSLTLQRK